MKFFYSISVLVFCVFLLGGCGTKIKQAGEAAVEQATGIGALEVKKEADKDIAIARAKTMFTQLMAEGIDLSNGPCIANNLIPDWVADVAHNPRENIDNLPENQCSAYQEGTVHHFVELDPSGSVIKAE